MSILSEGNNFGLKTAVKEDFSMGVEGPLGLNQGIPHGGPGKGVLPKPLYDPNAKAVPPTKKEDDDTEKNKKEMEKSLNKKTVSEAKLSRNCQLFIRKTDGSKTRLQFVTPAEARNSRDLIYLVNKYTSDWVELWIERYELDNDGYPIRVVEGKHIDNPKKVSEKKCCHGHNRLEEDAKKEYETALNLLRNLHYQVYNGGIQQCAKNGYLDDLEDYGTNQFIADIRNEIDVSTDAGAECLKAAQMFVDVLDEVKKTRICQDCGGDGQMQEEDEYGDVEYSDCPYCNGEGTIEVDRYADADFDDFSDNGWHDKWDEKYYQLNGDMIDDATGQTHTHSVVLDALRGAQKNESSISEAKNENSAKDLDKLGRLPDGEYEEWFGGWDSFPGLDSLKRAKTRNANCVYARYFGEPEEVTITDGASIGFGGSEDLRNPNWHTHKEMVCSDKSGIWEGDAVSFRVRHNGKSVMLKGKVIEKKYAGKWGRGGETDSWGRPTCSFTIYLTPKTIENAIAKLEGIY